MYVKLLLVYTSLIFSGSLFSETFNPCSKPIVIGWDEFQPFEYIDPNTNELKGIDIEVLKSIFSDLKCSVSFVKLPWKRMMQQLEDGVIDVVAAADYDLKKETFVNFTKPYVSREKRLFLKKGNVLKFPFVSLKDIENTKLIFSLGIVRGYTYGQEFDGLMEHENFSKHLSIVTEPSTNIVKLSLDRLDAVLEDVIVFKSYAKSLNYENNFDIHPLKFSDNDNYFIMLSKKNFDKAAVEEFNKALTKLKDSGKLQEIINKYI